MKIFIFLIAWTPFITLATEQIREILVVDGYPFEINQFPLEAHTSSQKIFEVYTPSTCSAAWRGYQGKWSLYDNKLYLSHLNLAPCSDRINLADLSKLFPDMGHHVEASWVNMDIEVPIGEYKVTWNGGNSPVIEFQAVVYKIENGILKTRTIQNIRK